MIIHNSDIRMFKRCRRKWDFSSPLRQHLKPKKIQDKLFLGTGVHKALEVYYQKYKLVKKKTTTPKSVLINAYKTWLREEVEKMSKNLFVEQQQLIEEQAKLGLKMLDNYYEWSRVVDPEFFTKVIFVEKKFRVKIGSEGFFEGKVDGIVQDNKKRNWLLENKTAARTDRNKDHNLSIDNTSSHLVLDEQVVSYLWALQKMLKIKFEGVIYNTLIKRIPETPRLLKNNTLSKSVNAKVTYESYLQAIKENKLKKKDYKEFLIALKKMPNQFFVREKIYKSPEEIEDIGIRIECEYWDMKQKEIMIYPNPTQDCGWDCSFRQVCIEMNQSGDWRYLLKTMFEKETRK